MNTVSTTLLPEPVEDLVHGEVRLFFVGIMPGEASEGLVPYYHHRILVDSSDVGHINFKVGDTDHIRLSAGHIGFLVKPMYRGNGYAGQACRAIIPLIQKHYSEVILTTDPGNVASIRTIEKLGVDPLDEWTVPPHDPQYASGSRIKKRYRWRPMSVEPARVLQDNLD